MLLKWRLRLSKRTNEPAVVRGRVVTLGSWSSPLRSGVRAKTVTASPKLHRAAPCIPSHSADA
jgi:hypothetical protein